MTHLTSRFERLELKYLVDELQADSIRAQIEATCEPDPHCSATATDRRGRVGYPIHSLYLDTPGLAFHEAKERGDPDRIKLRARIYADSPLASLEMKRRISNVVDKTRAMVKRELAEDAAMGRCNASGDEQVSRFLDDFSFVAATSGALPTLHVRYEREAYQSVVDDYARVTFDRGIEVSRTSAWDLEPGEDEDWARFDDHWRTSHVTTPVVLEIKCQSRIPTWVLELVRANQLEQTSFSKYSTGIKITDWMNGHGFARSRSAQVLG